MGGPMSTWEDEKHPWLTDEKRLIERLIEAQRPILGVCLGAQLMADVLGARTYRGAFEEIGWFPIATTPASRSDPVAGVLPDEFDTFLWHGDTFDLPDGALRIASSAAVENQGFKWSRLLALQFHLEVRPDWVHRIASRDAEQIVESRYVQALDEILGKPSSLYRANNDLMDRLLDAWLPKTLFSAGQAASPRSARRSNENGVMCPRCSRRK